jgi:hypothetical protein
MQRVTAASCMHLCAAGNIPDTVKEFVEANAQSRTDNLMQAAVEVMVRYATGHPSQPAVIYMEAFRNIPEDKQVSLTTYTNHIADMTYNGHTATVDVQNVWIHPTNCTLLH